MPITGDAAAVAYSETLQLFDIAIPNGWVDRTDGVMAGVTGVPMPTLNGVLTERHTCTESAVESSLDRVADSGLPYCLQVRPGVEWDVARLAAEHGLVRQEDIPVMALVDPVALTLAGDATPVSIRELSADEAWLHARVAAGGFEAPEWIFAQLLTTEVLALPGVRSYVAEVAGEIVATGLGATTNGAVGIFNIATLPEHRRRGYGAAVTARAVSDGLASGADWAWLQSSPQGFGVYRRLGFDVLETWQCWTNEQAPT